MSCESINMKICRCGHISEILKYNLMYIISERQMVNQTIIISYQIECYRLDQIMVDSTYQSIDNEL